MIAYTCTCIEYPCIQFCKHICTVQAHFPSVHQFIDLNKDPQERLFNYQSPSGTPTSTPCIEPQSLDTPLMSSATQLLKDLERLAAKLWINVSHEPHLDLQVVVEHELSLLYEARQLLPARVPRILPNQKSWSETWVVMVRMPPKKTQEKHAGERSGKKAKASHPEKPTPRGGERYGSISPEYDEYLANWCWQLPIVVLLLSHLLCRQ